jgi:hypothetical protein
MVDGLGPITGPVVIQDRFLIGENSIYLSDLGLTIPFSQIIGHLYYFAAM